MSFDQNLFFLSKKILSCHTNIPIEKIIHKNLSFDDLYKINKGTIELSKLPIFINETKVFSIEALKNQLLENTSIKVVILDYLQLMVDFSSRIISGREYDFVMRDLKALALELRVCIIVSSQIGRSNVNRGGDFKPHMSDLKGSGSIEEEADKVLLLYRAEHFKLTETEDGDSTKNLIELEVAKNRFGQTGVVWLLKNNIFTKILDYNETNLHYKKFDYE